METPNSRWAGASCRGRQLHCVNAEDVRPTLLLPSDPGNRVQPGRAVQSPRRPETRVPASVSSRSTATREPLTAGTQSPSSAQPLMSQMVNVSPKQRCGYQLAGQPPKQ